MKKCIVFVTDCVDIAYNELRAVVLSHLKSSDEIEIEPVAQVKPFSIINGNFVLRLMADVYPEGTIFSVILNPMKERPARLIGRTKKKNFIFMGANTGVFDWFLRDFGIEELYELHDPGFLPFGGKYVHAPAIAQIAEGKSLNDMGKLFNKNDLVKLDLIEGTIVHIDVFGLIKFIGQLPKCNEGDKFEVSIKSMIFKAVYATRMMSKNTGEWVVYPGSSLGLFEIGKVRCDGARKLGVKEGDIIKVRKIE
jgi:S-adenosylmethionine hydrolase